MREDDPVIAVVDALSDLKIPYMLVGSYSSNLHGVPRSTRDADFVIEPADQSITPLAERLKPHFTLDPQLGIETVAFHSRWHFHHRASVFKLEMFLLADGPFDQIRFQRRRSYPLCNRDIWFQAPEDVVVNKLRWARAKDLVDVADILGVQRGLLDWGYIEKWCEHFGRSEMIAKLKAEVG